MEKWQELEAYLFCLRSLSGCWSTPLAVPGVGEEQVQKWVSDTSFWDQPDGLRRGEHLAEDRTSETYSVYFI